MMLGAALADAVQHTIICRDSHPGEPVAGPLPHLVADPVPHLASKELLTNKEVEQPWLRPSGRRMLS
jgi:hypothetical protein